MKLVNISLDDWEGYYVDGKLVAQGHSVALDEILKALGHVCDSRYIGDDDLDEFGNSLPEDLTDIEEYIIRKQL